MKSTHDSAPATLRVLLVEDDPADAELLAMRLTSDPFFPDMPVVQLLHVGSVAAARAKLRDTAVDVIVLDLSLPDASGLATLHQVRDAAHSVPVIVLTGSDNRRQALAALRAGAQDYVLKPPPDGRSLGRILRYACERHRLLAQLDAARRGADMAARRWRLLAEVGRALGETDEATSAIDEVARIVVPDAADCFGLLLRGDDQMPSTVEIRHVTGAAGELRAGVRELLDARRAPDEPEAEPADSPGGAGVDDAVRLVFASLGVVGGTVVPVHFDGRARGVLLLATTAGRQDALTDVELARLLADRIASALGQAHLLRQTRRAVAARDRAVSIVSHDLRSPLSTVQICATALLDPTPAPASGVRQMAELIQRSASWMQQIVQDLLDGASLDAGRLALHRGLTDAHDVVIAARRLFEPVAREHSIEFIVDSASELGVIDADRDRLLQVLSNLIGNAIKFTPAGGRVTLSADQLGTEAADPRAGAGGVRFAVSDTGPGIPPEDLAHVFDWFWHAPRGNGTGLGLAIAKGLIEAHHAQLNVESIPGQGSTFWFTMPAALGAGHTHGGVAS